jgi:hypothetical protein
MQRQLIHGVPYFVNAQNKLYTWDTEAEPQHIGTYNPSTDTISYVADIQSKLAGRLQSWREQQNPRPRKPTNSRGHSRGAAAATQDSENDE